uniref:baculoviral IAP repeat-containing protein 5-like n=1 Tax=Styela clava TaxID=7725 RepID=UPI00193AB7D9|nr:baculoviral IAP repeat-containing protein 5-like [Styela clava]
MDKRLSMIEYDKRLDTLKHWPFTARDGATCTAEKLAEVGFFCPNPDSDPDALQCFLCLKPLEGWEPMDSPFDEHKSHSPDCKFLKLGLPEIEDIDNEKLFKCYCEECCSYSSSGRDSENVLKSYDDEVAKNEKAFARKQKHKILG